jgi:predicted nucleotidyltransferase
MLVPEKVMQRIQEVLDSSNFVGSVLLFGSRAREDCEPTSDIDLAVIGNPSSVFLSNLKAAGGLYKVDVIDVNRLDNDKLLRSIENDGICIYTSPSSSFDEMAASSEYLLENR